MQSVLQQYKAQVKERRQQESKDDDSLAMTNIMEQAKLKMKPIEQDTKTDMQLQELLQSINYDSTTNQEQSKKILDNIKNFNISLQQSTQKTQNPANILIGDLKTMKPKSQEPNDESCLQITEYKTAEINTGTIEPLTSQPEKENISSFTYNKIIEQLSVIQGRLNLCESSNATVGALMKRISQQQVEILQLQNKVNQQNQFITSVLEGQRAQAQKIDELEKRILKINSSNKTNYTEQLLQQNYIDDLIYSSMLRHQRKSLSQEEQPIKSHVLNRSLSSDSRHLQQLQIKSNNDSLVLDDIRNEDTQHQAEQLQRTKKLQEKQQLKELQKLLQESNRKAMSLSIK